MSIFLGQLVRLSPSLAKYTRRGTDLNKYYFINIDFGQDEHEFRPGSIVHLIDPDINQDAVMFIVWVGRIKRKPHRLIQTVGLSSIR
ncbi:hypothetical protein [Pelistega suis]|uniref:Uncharacterized protein n=1 Tax=Pelistega suis TaxID=1631957 RepID=A0A849P3L9_9BURK|nr:hypothetical protein [Pelistega suis]NOL51646.1 hypothetical protein [Pelistega suis]